MTVDRLYALYVTDDEKKKQYSFLFQADDYSTDGILKGEAFSLLCEKLSTLNPEAAKPNPSEPLNLNNLRVAVDSYQLSISYGMCSGFDLQIVEERWIEADYTQPEQKDLRVLMELNENHIYLEKEEENGN